MSSLFTVDQIVALRDYERSCVKKGDIGLRQTVQQFIDFVQQGGRLDFESTEGGISLNDLTDL